MKGIELKPQQVVERACKSGGIGIAYTYNEPIISFEFIYDCAVAARKAGLKNVLVTNGYINREPASELLPFIDALNIDIKSMEDSFYVEQCNGRLQPVLDFAVQSVESGAHVEITNLVIPGLNDDDSQIKMLAEWIVKNLGRKTPLHLSAYHPQFMLHNPATGKMKIMQAVDLAKRYMANVYAGNV
jgi:pyruvate formate lyase activating enzyme